MYRHSDGLLGTRNRRTLYICGTDEYDTATETQALKEGLTPRALCAKYNALHVETYKWFELRYGSTFIRRSRRAYLYT